MATPRKALTFDLPATAPTPAAVAEKPSPTAANDKGERQQVGARVTKATYRQLKARAALQGETVQALVEQAISEFLSRG